MIVSRRHHLLPVLVTLWTVGIGLGFACWMQYDLTPGPDGDSVASGPTGHWTLTLYVHPRCPCSRSALREMEEILSRSDGRLQGRVVLVSAMESGDWDGPWTVVSDGDGALARQAGAMTSGCAVVTDPDGLEVYRGGLTPGRGQVGPGVARGAILDLLQGHSARGERSPVFGCRLFDAL